MRKYFTKKKLDSDISQLVARQGELRAQLNSISEELSMCYKRKATLEEIASVKIRFGDLLEGLKVISGHEITDIKLVALPSFANPLDIPRTEYEMNIFGSQLFIKFDNQYFIWYLTGFKLFDNLDDLQVDGKTLLQHCAFVNSASMPTTFHDLVVYSNKEDVICHITLNNLLNSPHEDDDNLLQQAVFSLIENNNVLDIEYAKDDEVQLRKKRN